MLRTLLVGSARHVLGPFGQDSDLRRHEEKMAARGCKNAKKRAAVTVARKVGGATARPVGERRGT